MRSPYITKRKGRRSHFPLRNTLLEAIYYSYASQAKDKQRVIALMKQLNFSKEIIHALKKKEDNWSEQLRGGASTSCYYWVILHQPDILFMDEGTSAIDPANRQLCE